ncbi:MAG TPA: 2,3-diphosphoglycerate-dependent phosphoglycerate mutase [Acidimicrobiia bacterium]|nr:2,3-diphosphoglycerate-dependent phosphoglycerate mutase [Acidimicrobiia bacterium]
MATLVLLRHGQSTWNEENRFTGWVDVDLTERGRAEATTAGEMLLEHAIMADVVHTSLQKRAIRSADLALTACDRRWIPVRRSWRLNERHYGALQGLNKRETAEEHGLEQVNVWRRSYATAPPALPPDDPTHPRFDPRYASIPAEVLPSAESLADVVDRVLPYWYDGIVPDLRGDTVVFVVAHGNSLRALVKHLDGLSDDEVVALNIPTGQPLVYDVGPRYEIRSHRYLDPDAATTAANAVAHQAG